MFVQVIKGRVDDAPALRAALDDWLQDVAPGAIGWLGSTAGVTDDGRSIAIVRFESEQAARANSDRPEQDQWWAQTSKLFNDEPTFAESSDVMLDIAGDPSTAGFVQIMQGRGSDPERAKELMSQDSGDWAAFRPEILGSVAVGHDAAPTRWRSTSRPGRGSRGRDQGDAGGPQGADGGDGRAQPRRARVLRPSRPLAARPDLTRNGARIWSSRTAPMPVGSLRS